MRADRPMELQMSEQEQALLGAAGLPASWPAARAASGECIIYSVAFLSAVPNPIQGTGSGHPLGTRVPSRLPSSRPRPGSKGRGVAAAPSHAPLPAVQARVSGRPCAVGSTVIYSVRTDAPPLAPCRAVFYKPPGCSLSRKIKMCRWTRGAYGGGRGLISSGAPLSLSGKRRR